MWRNRALCVDTDPELFFPISAEGSTPHTLQLREAQRICNNCPVKGECVDEAVRLGLVGIWGGTTERERRAMKVRTG